MLKYLGKLFCIYGLLQITAIACCPDLEPYYSTILDIKAVHSNVYTPIPDSAIVPHIRHRIRCTISQKAVPQNAPLALLQRVHATSCEAQYLGLKSDIVTFEIRCNRDIFNTPKGTPLALDAIRVYNVQFTDDARNKRLTVEQWLSAMNTGSAMMTTEWYLEFQEPFASSEYLAFTLLFEQDNGTIFQVETQAVKVE